MEENTAQSIMRALETAAKEKQSLDWRQWLEGATKLAALIQLESDELAEMEYAITKVKARHVEDGKPANQAKLLTEADPLYLDYLKKKSFVKRCDEMIKISKKFATLSADQMKY